MIALSAIFASSIMQKEARFERTFCSTNIISQPFLEVAGGAVTSLFLALSVVFEAKMSIP